MEVPAAVACADTRTHTHTHAQTLTSVQLSQPIGHHIGCSVEQRIGIIYSLLKKKMVPCISLSPRAPGWAGSTGGLQCVSGSSARGTGSLRGVPAATPRPPQRLPGHRTPQFIWGVSLRLPIHTVKDKNANIGK